MNSIYEKLNFSDKYLMNSKLDKTALFEVADLLSSDKKIIQNSVEKITTKYSLNPNTINLQPYISDDRDYYEIEIMEVILREPSKYKRIAEILMRTIPYPILLIFVFGNKVLFATGDMRKNIADSSKVTVDDFVYTDWINVESYDEYSNKLFASLDISTLNATNYYTMYQDITSKLNLYNFSKVKGEVVTDLITMSNSDIKESYDRINEIDAKIQALQNGIKKNTPIDERVEVSIQINKLRKEKEKLLNN